MKQGRASRNVSESWKRDPHPHAMSVKAVGQIGTSLGDHITGHKRVLRDVAQPLHAGRGFMSPLGARGTPGVGVGRTIHPKGGQGRR